MTKKLAIIAGGSLLFVFLVLVLALLASRQTKRPSRTTPTATPYPTVVAEPGALNMVGSRPGKGESNVDVNSSVEITFNRPLSISDVRIEFLDDQLGLVPYESRIMGSKLTLVPNSELKPSIVYTVRVRDQYVRTLGEFSFLTRAGEVTGVDTRPIAALTETMLRNRNQRPDLYLIDHLPYQNASFRMELESANNFDTFVVTSSTLSGAELQQAVNNWLLSIELTQEQINTLVFEYR